MPAFLLPLQHLVENGHEIDLICINERGLSVKPNVGPDWLGKVKLVAVIDRPRLGRLRAAWTIYRTTAQQLKSSEYDVVFAHGPIAEPSRIAARRQRVPFVQRLYGTFYFHRALRDGWLITKFKRPFEYLSLTTKKSALIMTNDGTLGDRVVKKLNRNKLPFDFHFLLNGVALSNPVLSPPRAEDLSAKRAVSYVFVCARLERWKGQMAALELCRLLRDEGCPLRFRLAGQFYDVTYLEELRQYVYDHHLESLVEFLGPVPSHTIPHLARRALFCFFSQEYSNLGNVFHEVFAAGGVILCRMDDSVADFIIEAETGFYFRSLREALAKVKNLVSDPALRNTISDAAMRRSSEVHMSWRARVQLEEDILAAAANIRVKHAAFDRRSLESK